MTISRILFLLFSFTFWLSLSSCVPAKPAKTPPAKAMPTLPISENEIQTIAKNALTAFYTPGVAIGIIKDGQIVFLEGYGLRDVENNLPVTPKTQFRIASTTKAFTSAALAILVDEGKLHWDDKVIKYIPEFKMWDSWVTKEFTIRDLLTHRSGLGLGAGDLMLWPEPSGFSRAEIIRALRYLKPVSSFRSRYAYDNLLYIVAGEVVSRASGQSYESFVQNRIFAPLGMNCFAGEIDLTKLENVAIPYGYTDEKLSPVERNKISGKITASQPAGGLVCNAEDMTIWLNTQLAGGVGQNGVRIFSQAQRDEMWQAQTILPIGKTESELDGTHLKAYALGWRVEDMHGFKLVSHTGTLSGFQAYVALVPEQNLGIVILNNGSNYGVRNAIMQSLLKAYMGQEKRDWVQYYKEQQEQRYSGADKFVEPVGSGKMSLPNKAYAGQYRDNWFGQVDIVESQNGLRFQSLKSINLKGRLEPFENNTFIVRWDNRGFGADAFARFIPDRNGQITGLKMRLVDPDADFSFDFQDLNFRRVAR